MPDREKVINGLECCLVSYEDRLLYQCDDCPYRATEDERKVVGWCCHLKELRSDALELLKGQESLKQKMWNALYAEEDKLENHYVGTNEIDKWIVDYRPFLQRGFEIAIEVIAAHEEGR